MEYRTNSGKASMLRYLGYLLMVLAVLALAAAAVVCLFGGLAEQFRMPGSVRLIALDDVVETQAQHVRAGAQLDDFDYAAPLAGYYMVVRYDDGWCRYDYTDSAGLVRWARRGPLPVGRREYAVMFCETHPRADIRARGTVWVVSSGMRALWVDAAALCPEMLPGGPPSSLPQAAAMRPALETLKTLARGRQVVYLVAADIAQYQAFRDCLGEAGAPPGPVIWLRKGNELGRLTLLKEGWRDVDGAVVAAPVVADVVARLKVRVVRLPRQGEEAGGGP